MKEKVCKKIKWNGDRSGKGDTMKYPSVPGPSLDKRGYSDWWPR